MFASGYTWGPIKRADVTIGSKKASNLPIQVIGDSGYTVPSDCMSRGGPNLGSLLGSQRQLRLQRYRRHRPFRARHRNCGANADPGDVLLLPVHKLMCQHTRAASQAGHESGRGFLNQ